MQRIFFANVPSLFRLTRVPLCLFSFLCVLSVFSTWFSYNDTRQCSFVYGVEAVKQFLKDNKLTSIIRAHEAQVDGYKMQMVHSKTAQPQR